MYAAATPHFSQIWQAVWYFGTVVPYLAAFLLDETASFRRARASLLHPPQNQCAPAMAATSCSVRLWMCVRGACMASMVPACTTCEVVRPGDGGLLNFKQALARCFRGAHTLRGRTAPRASCSMRMAYNRTHAPADCVSGGCFACVAPWFVGLAAAAAVGDAGQDAALRPQHLRLGQGVSAGSVQHTTCGCVIAAAGSGAGTRVEEGLGRGAGWG